MKYSIKSQIFLLLFQKIKNWNLEKNKEIESNKIKAINIVGYLILPFLYRMFKFIDKIILKKEKSKYVLQYNDSFDENNNVYIIMEYCECGNLNDFKRKKKNFLNEDYIKNNFIFSRYS